MLTQPAYNQSLNPNNKSICCVVSWCPALLLFIFRHPRQLSWQLKDRTLLLLPSLKFKGRQERGLREHILSFYHQTICSRENLSRGKDSGKQLARWAQTEEDWRQSPWWWGWLLWWWLRGGRWSLWWRRRGWLLWRRGILWGRVQWRGGKGKAAYLYVLQWLLMMRELQIWDEGKFDQISIPSPTLLCSLQAYSTESSEEVAEGQPSLLSNGKIANSQLFSHPPIWFSLLSVPNKCTIRKFSGYWLWTYSERWVSDQKDLWLRSQTQLESLLLIS